MARGGSATCLFREHDIMCRTQRSASGSLSSTPRHTMTHPLDIRDSKARDEPVKSDPKRVDDERQRVVARVSSPQVCTTHLPPTAVAVVENGPTHLLTAHVSALYNMHATAAEAGYAARRRGGDF